MEKEELRKELRERLIQIQDPYREKKELYSMMDQLGLSYKPTNCKMCILDYFHILQEELGLIEDASEVSEFNGTHLVYVYPRTVKWNGHSINEKTPEKIKREFHKTHKGFFIEQAIIPFEDTK